jgi:hypothetical protein
MTIAADWLHERFPKRDRYPLPPREISVSIRRRRRRGFKVGEPQRRAATLLSP